MTDIEQQARELLAREYRTHGQSEYADIILNESPVGEDYLALRAIAAALSAQAPSEAVAHDMVLVPREPTPEVIERICSAHAANSFWPDDYGATTQRLRRQSARMGYAAMIASASGVSDGQ